MRLVITFKVDYDEATVPDEEELRRSVEAECMVAVGRGLLTTEDEVVVDEYNLSVKWKY